MQKQIKQRKKQVEGMFYNILMNSRGKNLELGNGANNGANHGANHGANVEER